jgi:hypothetical protein
MEAGAGGNSDFHENRRCHAKVRSPAFGGVGAAAAS